jgi:hypothetical protein
MELFAKLEGLEGNDLCSAVQAVYDDHRSRLSALLKLPAGTEVVLCPSGSDAEYIPIAIARALKGNDVHITNGITQLSEIGAGSAPASVGKYFSTHVPLVGRLSGEREVLSGFENLGGITVSARDNDGNVVDAATEMDNFAEEAFARGAYPIIHGVFGGKTGLRDSKMAPSLEGGDKSLSVVDACQGRFSTDELHEWLNQDSLVLFTASKFYQAPPFCGAVLIPKGIADKLHGTPAPQPHSMFDAEGLGGFFTEKEMPPCLQSWGEMLGQERRSNVGLALRWEAGLAGMEALAHVPDDVRTAAVDDWAGTVTEMVNREGNLDAWCTERSIVSIRVQKEGDGWLSMSELRDLYRWMSMDISGLVPDATAEEKEALSQATYIGQPVHVSNSHAIVRIALGVESLVSYLDDSSATLEEDLAVVKKLAAIGKHFATLKESGQ